MPSSRVSSKGQVTIPQEVRVRLGLRAGDRVEFAQEGEKTVLRPSGPQANPFLEYVGILPHFKTREAINAWIRELRDEDPPRE